jgi:4-hydroxy-tetrahydrodipicolinate synthase
VRFAGVIGYPITPTADDGGLDLDSFQRLVRRGAAGGLGAVGVLGSSGGFAYLNRGERADVVRAAVGAAGDTGVAAGISAPGTREILQHALDACEAGAAGLILSAVSYHPLRDAEVLALVRSVAAETALPVCLYNNPRTTQYDFPLEVVAELSGLDTVVAFKDSAATPADFSRRCQELAPLVPAEFSHGMSGDLLIATSGRGAGGQVADAWHSGPAALLPELYVSLRAALGQEAADRSAALPSGAGLTGSAPSSGGLTGSAPSPGVPSGSLPSGSVPSQAVVTARARLLGLLEVMARMPKGSVLHSLARLTGTATAAPRLPLLPLTVAEETELAAAVDRALL